MRVVIDGKVEVPVAKIDTTIGPTDAWTHSLEFPSLGLGLW